MNLRIVIFVTVLAVCVGCGGSHQKRSLISFKESGKCYDRQVEPFTSVVDSHIHFRPFGGPAVPFSELNDYFNRTGVRFVSIYGIGQTLPVNSECTYYLSCPGTVVKPSIKNDFVNAANYLEFKPKNVHMILSMTFPDMEHPETILPLMEVYDREFPDMFKMAGEVNLVKQALFGNGHHPVSLKSIDGWAPFMEKLRDRHIPLNIHSDLGNNSEPTKYLHLMEYVLSRYPDNQIIWAHMGLSKELSSMNVNDHIQVMMKVLDAYPNLMLDLSWRVLDDHYFSKPGIRDRYVAFINTYSERILPGTDFVASRDKDFDIYKNELKTTSDIHRFLSDKAFRNIALGENYFRVLRMGYRAPQICK